MNRHYGRPNVLTLGLAALNALLVLTVAAETRPAGEIPSEQAKQPMPAQAGAAAASPKSFSRFALPPLQQYEEIVARPIFSEGRRPEAHLSATGPVVDAPFSLKGVVITPQVREAWLVRKGSPDIVRAIVGHSIDGWEIDAIERDLVRLRRGSQGMALLLERPSPSQLQVSPQGVQR